MAPCCWPVARTRLVKATGSGWYDIARLAPISVKAPSTPPGMWSTYVFERWSGDIDSENTKARVMMNQPKTVIAEFKEDSTPGIVNGIILGLVGVIGVVVYKKTHKQPTFGPADIKEKNGKPKSFEQFFNTRTTDSKTSQSNSQLISNPNKLQATLSWLLGRNK